MGVRVQSFLELDVYKVVFSVQQEIFQLSKLWPSEEKYALTDQIRRSSRSIGANLAEAWAKRRYVAHFLSKCTDADGELQETEHWLTTAWACDYIMKDQYEALLNRLLLLGRKLGSVIQKHEAFRAV
ncbi:MAG: four helix bundle protein [Kiritimatiellia bacterium]